MPDPGPQLYVRNPVQIFRPGQEDALDASLTKIDASTSLECPPRAEVLMLDAQGKTKISGLRYTSGAFHQLCSKLCPGLSRLVPSLAGMTRTANDLREYYSMPRAVEAFNDVLDLRWGRLGDVLMIRDHDKHQIEGFIGSTHKFLKNRDLYQQVKETMQETDCIFHSAILAGRRLALRFAGKDPMFKLHVSGKPLAFRLLYYFANGEAAGTSVKGTAGLSSSYGCSLHRFRRRVRHSGKDFERKLGRMLASVIADDVQQSGWQSRVGRLVETSLDIPVEDAKRFSRVEDLMHNLVLRGLPKRLSEITIMQAVYGKEEENGQKSGGHRNYWDVYAGLVYEARRLPMERRELVEQLAHRLLLGKFKFH